MTKIEKLARRICWLEFSPPRRMMGDERAYWKSLPQESRDEMILDARCMLAALRELERTKSGCILLNDARAERDASNAF